MSPLLDQLAACHAPSTAPLPLFPHHARYQRCAWVRAHAQGLGRDWEFPPSYSPNLNLIERYWRWVKKRCLNARSHADFGAMKAIRQQTTVTAHDDYSEALASWLTWHFQNCSQTPVTK